MLISGMISNLIGGVSQQPDALRLENTGTVVENAWLSVVNGQGKRPRSEHVAKTSMGPTARNMMGYLIDRDEDYRYILTIANNDLRVFDLADGSEQTVNFPNGKAYLASALDPIDSFRFVTIGDTTFILNRERTAYAVDYGEDGDFTFSPDGTVNTTDELPLAAGTTDVYYVADEDRYYRDTQFSETPDILGWRADTPWQITSPAGYTVVGTTLPIEVTLGRQVAITKTVYQRYYSGGKWRTRLVRYYQGFTGVIVTPATGVTYAWVAIKNTDLGVEITNDRKDPRVRATVHVTQAVANSNYAVYINNVLKASFTTKTNVDAATALEPTTTIAEDLRSDLAGAGYTVSRYGSTVVIKNLDPEDTIQATTTNGDKALKAFRSTVPAFDDLPPNAEYGQIVGVAGDRKENGDDYFVEWTEENVWRETYAYGSAGRLVARTMPHVLVREADGTWTFRTHEWMERDAGSTDSNPAPSFDRRTIKDIFVWNNRLGLLADENVILSETGNYENFYRTTLVNLADSDALDYAVLHNNVNILQHAVSFSKDLVLFSNQNQFRFQYQNFLGPKNIQVQYTTSFNNSTRIHPINVGASVYFVDDQKDYQFGRVYEYFLREDGISDDAEDVTAATPEYIPSTSRWMAGSAANKVLFVGTEGDPSAIYVYKFFWAGEKKVQTSWSRWVFEDNEAILWGGVLQGDLYLLLERHGEVYIERVSIEEGVIRGDDDLVPYLDRLTELDMTDPTVASYDAGTDKTRITLPWGLPADAVPELIASEPLTDPDGEAVRNFRTRNEQITRDDVYDNWFYVDGDWTSHYNVYAGIPYTHLYEFSKIYPKQPTKNGGQAPSLDSRVQMRRMMIEYHNTVAFKASLTLPGREPWIQEYFSNLAGTPLSPFGQLPFAQGVFRVPLAGENNTVKLEISNDTPYPANFGSAEWQAMYQPKARAM